ncbi:MAG TPA: hypothetical protein VLX92_26030 [Kofleriaceae bacterium]|nr:hypothetical protein [Kofleriaceae bacterium]
MRCALAVAVVAIASCGKRDKPAPIVQPPRRDAAAIAVDWASCERALHDAPGVPEAQRVAALIDGCKVCGDWTPILRWSTPQAQGGPTRVAIEQAMSGCDAWCDPNAKQRFLGTLDTARGTTSRAPWRYLGEGCRDKVSAVPDARFMSGPFFALDRIARAAAAHGGAAAQDVAAIEVALPAVSITAAGLELPTASRGAQPLCAYQITMLGDQLLVGKLPRGQLGAHGVQVDFGGEPYPGKPVKLEAAAAALAALAGGTMPPVVVFAARSAPAAPLHDLVGKLHGARVFVAVDGGSALPAWPTAAMIAVREVAIHPGETVQDYVTAMTGP